MKEVKDYDSAIELQKAGKTELKAAREELRAFKKENKIKKDAKVEDKKIASKLEKLEATVVALKEKQETIDEKVKELKPRKDRVVKYEYPEGLTDAEKKSYRAKKRREANKAAKGEDENVGAEESTQESTGGKAKKKISKKSKKKTLVKEGAEEAPAEDED